MRLSGRPGRVKLHFGPAEVELLDVLLAELDDVVAEPGDDEVGRRLYPAALPDDGAASEQFRELTEESLRTGRHERIAACRAELAQLPVRLAEPDAARRWLQVLNDLRLVLGTRLGVTDDGLPDPVEAVDEADTEDAVEATVAPYAVYDYLTGVQELLVQALMR